MNEVRSVDLQARLGETRGLDLVVATHDHAQALGTRANGLGAVGV